VSPNTLYNEKETLIYVECPFNNNKRTKNFWWAKVMNVKRWLFEAYLMLRFMFYGVDDPREEEMIARKASLKGLKDG